MADGSITAVVDLDDKNAQQQLTKLKKQIDSLEFDTKVKEATKARLESELADLRAAQKAINADDDAAQKAIEKQYDAVAAKIERLTTAINENKDALGVAKTEAGQLADSLSGMGDAGEEAGGKTASAIGKLEKRLVGLAKRVFVFSVITAALRSMRTWLSKAVKSNDEAAAAIARLKGALLTLAQPILNVVIPAFIFLVNILTRVVSAIAAAVSALGGTTAKASADAAKSLYEEQDAIKGVGGAAKKASKQLAAFDEINKLSAEDAGGGGGGGAADGIAPDFSTFIDDGFLDYLGKILDIVSRIGALLLAWKIGSALGLGLGKTMALFVALYASIEFVKNLIDMWANGVTMDKLRKALLALAVAAAGFGIALGPVAAGIALVVGGLALLATGIHDAMENGMNWANTLTMIAGILATGLGLSLITGSFIPLFIAAVAGALLALVQFTGHGEELMKSLRKVFDGFLEFIAGVFTGDWKKAFAGLQKMGEGFREAWNAIVKSVQDAWASFVKWFDEKTNGEFHQYLEAIGTWLSGLYDSFKTILSGIVDFIAGVFTGDWDRAWKGVKNVFIGIINGIITAFEGMVNLIISGINSMTRGINAKLKISIPSWVPEYGGRTFGVNIPEIPTVTLNRIPALAAGAVIPPNREFLAVLGDQRSGTNIEAPLETIKQALIEAMAEGGGGSGTITVVVNLDGREIARNTVNNMRQMQRAGALAFDF